jgi:nickel/cobalt exporter
VEKQEEYRDAHELAHARDIERRFNGTKVTNGQILLFGLTVDSSPARQRLLCC